MSSSNASGNGTTIYYHIIDAVFGLMGSNNSYMYTQKTNTTLGPPHNFPLFFGSDEPAPSRRNNWLLQDTQFVLIAAVVIFVLRRFVIEKLIAYFTGGKSKTNRRIQENAWFTIYYTVSSVAGFFMLQNASWLYDLDELIIGYPETHTGFEHPFMREYLLVGAAFYVQALFALLFIDEKMKDFWEMLIHHFATIGLVVGCVLVHYHRIGTLVLMLHDVVDIFLYSAKTSKHLNNSEHITTTLFALFVLSFFILRLVFYPVLIFKTMSNHKGWDYHSRYYMIRYVSDSTLPVEVSDYGICIQRYCLSSYWTLFSLMSMLIVLHIFWFTLISKIIWRQIVGRGLDDIREDDVDNSDDEDDKKKKKD